MGWFGSLKKKLAEQMALTCRTVSETYSLRIHKNETLCHPFRPCIIMHRPPYLIPASHKAIHIHDATGWPTGSTTGWVYVYTAQPVVQPVGQRFALGLNGIKENKVLSG